MLKLRLSRGGTKKRPVYKVVVADSRFARDGRFIEKVGFFNPLLPKEKKERVGLEAERIKYWLGQGAQPTTRVARILGENELMPMPANGNNPNKAVPKKERIGLEAERIKYWLGQGAQPTTRVARILGENELMPMPANGNNPQKAVPKKDRKKEGSEEPKKEDAPKADTASAGEAPKAEAKKEEAPKAEAKKEEAPKAEALKEEKK